MESFEENNSVIGFDARMDFKGAPLTNSIATHLAGSIIILLMISIYYLTLMIYEL